MKKKNEFIYFALKNMKLRVGSTILFFFLIFAFVGPLLTHFQPFVYVHPGGPSPPGARYWFGTTWFGQDVFTQFVHGLRATFLVGGHRRGARNHDRDNGRVHRRLSRGHRG